MRKLNIETSDEYDLAARGMLRSLIALLRESLIEAKVSPRKQRQICENFCVSLCDHMDQGWFRIEGQTFYPLLAFTRTFLNTNTKLQEVEPVLFLDKSNLSFFEMFAEEADILFDDTEPTSSEGIIGVVGEEIADAPATVEDSPLLPQPCPVCVGTGKCFCIRKGSGNPAGCTRCNENGACRHCQGIGYWKESNYES